MAIYTDRDSPPGQVCVMATQTLLRLTEAFPTGIAPLEPVKHLRITDMEFVQTRDEREKLESTMDYFSCKRCPQFEEHVSYLSDFISRSFAIVIIIPPSCEAR